MDENDFIKTADGYLMEVRVTPNSGKNELIKLETGFRARVQSAPVEGMANERLIELLAKVFKTAKSNIEIVKGHTGRNKVVLLKISKLP